MWPLITGALDRSTVSIHFVRNAIKKAAEQGYDWKALLRESEIEPALLEQDGAYVPVRNYAMLQQITMLKMGNEMLGYGHGTHKLGAWISACRAAVHPGPLGHVLSRLCKFYSLFEWGPQIRLTIEGEEAVLEASPYGTGEDYEIYTYELVLSTVHRFAGWLINESIPLQAVSFQHDRPMYAAEYRWLFQHSPVFFNRSGTSFRFDRQWLNKPLQRDQRSLEDLLRTGCLGLFESECSEPTWAERLRELVDGHLPDVPEFDKLANALQMHPQTLRRRLASEGITYNEIKDQVRRDAAEYYLREQLLSIEEIAFRSGFSEASAFIRAFKRWNGITPHAYAEKRRGRFARQASELTEIQETSAKNFIAIQ